jgi:glycosyltransferase involved in cell wall biosynthesis
VKVFLAGTSLLPAYGGPALSVSRLATALTELGIEVGLWAANDSAKTTPLLSPGSSVRRLTGTEFQALDDFGGADILHDNGMWLPHNHRIANLAARYNIPRVVSTRGMLEPWAINHKWGKKRVAWWLYQKWDLKRAHCHHTTAEAESRNVQRLGLGVPVRVIPNGVDLPNIDSEYVQNKKVRRSNKKALFLGRIYPVKGLPMLIKAWARVRPQGWRLQIAGPDEAGHLITVKNEVLAAGLSETVSFLGPISGPTKDAALLNADLFVLPTYSESFGMSIAEALAHGLPVLTTTGAPWPMLQQLGCGWWVDPTVDGIAEGLRQATSSDSETLQAMGRKGRAFVEAEYRWERIAKQFIATYEAVLNSSLNESDAVPRAVLGGTWFI